MVAWRFRVRYASFRLSGRWFDTWSASTSRRKIPEKRFLGAGLRISSPLPTAT